MGRKKDTVAPPAQEQPATTSEAPVVAEDLAAPEPEPQPKPNVKALFAEYEQRSDELSVINAQYEAATKARSNSVKAILDATGSKGPYRYKGQLVTIVGRTHRGQVGNAEAEVTYFFKGGTHDVVNVDE